MPDTATATPPRDPAPFPIIPYGLAHFKGIRQAGWLYVDKTRFLHELEQVRFVFLIRPRRFGKSCWLSLLESYYDRAEAADFEAVFAGTAIGANPTPNRSRYVLRLLRLWRFPRLPGARVRAVLHQPPQAHAAPPPLPV